LSRSSPIPFPDAVPSAPDDAADYWAAKRMLGTLTARDEARFLAWLKEPENAEAYAEVQGVVSAAGDIAADPAILGMRAEALKASPTPKTPSWRAIAGVAAGVVVVACAGVVGLRSLDNPSRPSVIATQSGAWAVPGTKRYETQVGERRDVRLDDGSVISLNTGSVIEVAYTSARRDVRLLRGQALFQVAHDARWPFVVSAGDRAVTAVGTAFDIRLQGDAVSVVLIEGKVRVDPLRRQGLQRLIGALGGDDLIAGQQLVSTQGVPGVVVNSADVPRVTSWRNGQVIFRDDTLAAAIAELNRYSERPILATDPRVAGLKVSGVFGVSRPENFVAAVTTMLPVEATTSGDAVLLTWREDGGLPASETFHDGPVMDGR
jgi:transmembrane sensor